MAVTEPDCITRSRYKRGARNVPFVTRARKGKAKIQCSSAIALARIFDFYAHASDKWDASEKWLRGAVQVTPKPRASGQGADTGRSTHYDPHGQRGENASLGLTRYRAPNNPLTEPD